MTLSMADLQAFIKRCDPSVPLRAGDPMYVALDEGTPVRGGDGRSCIDELERTLLFSEESARTCQLFSGFPGTGKTTELLLLKRRLNENKQVSTHALLIDFEQYVDRFTPITITDVLRVLAYGLEREAAEAEALAAGKAVPTETSYLRRLFDFMASTDVELKKIGFDAYGASLMLELKDNPTFRQRAEAALALRFQQFAREASDWMTRAVVRLRKATGAQRIVVLADGLEKLTPMREEDRGSMEASVETLFVQNASWLRLPCHAIYTFPLWLRFRIAPLGALYDREPQILPMVKIGEPDRRVYPAGIAKLTEMVAKRIDLSRVFGTAQEETFLPLVTSSGGYPRDLLRMVRELLYQARAFPVTPAETQRIISRIAESYAQTIRTADLPLLAEIDETHSIPQGDGPSIAAFGRLLEQWLVLAYRNGHEWYDLHPLVRGAPAVQKRLSAGRA